MNGKKYLVVILILAVFLRLAPSWALIFSIGSIVAIWYFVGQLFPKIKWMKETSALFLAISPWHISLIHYSWKITFAVFIAILGTILSIKYFKKSKWLFVLVAVLIMITSQLLSSFALDLTNAEDVIWLTDQQRREHGQNYDGFTVKLLHNKVMNYSLSFLGHYSDHFSGDFLFFNEETLMYLFDIVFLLTGFFNMIKKSKWERWGIILMWLILAPINSTFTFSPPDFLRSALMIVPLIIISSFGAITSSEVVYKFMKGCTIKR